MTRGSNTPRCYCKAYPYPHRVGAGACDRENPGKQGDEPYELTEEEKQKRENNRNTSA